MWMLAGGIKVLPCYFEDSDQLPAVGKALNTIHFNIYYVDGTTSLNNNATIELGLGWYGYSYTSTENKDFIYNAVDTTAIYPNFPGAFVELQVKSIDDVYTDTPARVWINATRTLSSFGTLVADTATYVWGSGSRTLTSFGTLVLDISTAVWTSGTRTLTSFGTLIADIWTYSTRALTSFGTLVADVSTAVWTTTIRTLTDFGTLAHDVWEYLTSNLTTVGSIGKFILDKLNFLTGGDSTGYIVTIQYYETATTTPIVQAEVIIRNSADTVVLTKQTTDVNGQVIFNLPAETYHVFAYKLGVYSFTLPETLIVSVATSITYYGSPFVIPAPATPGICRVYGWEYRPNGLPYQSILVTAQLQDGPYFASEVGILVTQRSAQTNEDGYWYLDLTRSVEMLPVGAKYLIEVAEQNYSSEVTVPDSATVNYKDLI